MPTVLRVEGFRFYFFSNERGEPPHVHVNKGDAMAKLWLQPVKMAHSFGFNSGELRRIREIVFEHQVEIVEKWNDYFDR